MARSIKDPRGTSCQLGEREKDDKVDQRPKKQILPVGEREKGYKVDQGPNEHILPVWGGGTRVARLIKDFSLSKKTWSGMGVERRPSEAGGVRW